MDFELIVRVSRFFAEAAWVTVEISVLALALGLCVGFAAALAKVSTLVSAISVVELTYTAHRFISSTYRPFEMFMLSAVFYLLIILAASHLIRTLDARFALRT